MNRIERISAIHIMLQSKRIVKAQEIANRFHISLRTVYRDMAALEESGVPLIGEAGQGYSLAEGYRLPPVMFTNEEATALITAEKLIEKFTDIKTYELYHSAMIKIRSVLKSSGKAFLEHIEEYIKVSDHPFLPKRFNQDQHIQSIIKALANKSMLNLDYFANHSQEDTTRKVDPVGIYFLQGRWHLIAFCYLRKDYRQFRLDRIKKIVNLEEKTNIQHPALDQFLKSEFKNESELFEIEMTIPKEKIKYIGDQKYYMGVVTEQTVGDKMHYKFLTSSVQGFARWYMMIGDAAEIVNGPKTLFEEIQKVHEAIKLKF